MPSAVIVWSNLGLNARSLLRQLRYTLHYLLLCHVLVRLSHRSALILLVLACRAVTHSADDSR